MEISFIVGVLVVFDQQFWDGVAFDSTVCLIKLSSLSERTPSSTLLCSSCNACSLTSVSFSLDASLAFLVRWPSTHLQ